MPRALVTGATNGIGLEIARGLAREGFRVQIVARNPDKAAQACRDIMASSGHAQPGVLMADFDRLQDVRELARQVLADPQPLDLLVNNAGVVTLKREQTADGFERMFGVNYLAHYLLTRLLLPSLRASPQGGRVVNVASEAHRFVKGMRWDDLQSQQDFRAMKTYGHSKLANLLFTMELARREPGLLVLAAHPGAVSTGLGAQNGWLGKLATGLLKPFFRTPVQGAATPLMLATCRDPGAPSGSYFADGKPKRPAAWAVDPVAAQRLWEASAGLCGLAD